MKKIFEIIVVFCILTVVWILGSPQEISGKDMLGGCKGCSMKGNNYSCTGILCGSGCNLCRTGDGHCGLPEEMRCNYWSCDSRCTNINCS